MSVYVCVSLSLSLSLPASLALSVCLSAPVPLSPTNSHFDHVRQVIKNGYADSSQC